MAGADSNSVLAAQLKQQLDLAEHQAAEQAERLAEFETERATLSARLDEQAGKADEAEQRAHEAESERDELAGSVAFDQAIVEFEEQSTERLVAQQQRVLTKLVGAGVVPAQQHEQELPAPGQPWLFTRGEDVWTLSRARWSLVTYDGRESLDELWPRPDV